MISKGNMKIGVEVPDVLNTLHLDKENGKTQWRDTIAEKYEENGNIAYKKLPDGENMPHGFTEISCYLIFGVKFGLLDGKTNMQQEDT